MDKIKIGYLPTRRDVFSPQEARRFAEKIHNKLGEFNIDIVDISDLVEDGILVEESDVQAVVDKMLLNKVDGIFIPHCNFGSERAVSEAARKIGKPVLLWGPRDDAPDSEKNRSRDTQCGLFATGKVLRRNRVYFSYIENCSLSDAAFEQGFRRFVAVCNVVREFYNTRILQISTRPSAFMSVIANEGELLERFGIRVVPISLQEFTDRYELLAENETQEVSATVNRIKQVQCQLDDKDIVKIAALKCAMKELCRENRCNGVAIQCWNALQEATGMMPCAANGLLTEEGIPVACETDLHGVITSRILSAAAMGEHTFFADITGRHPTDDNAELLWHCGNFPIEFVKDIGKSSIGHHAILPSKCVGTGEWELKDGNLTIARFDGDNGEYKIFFGECETTTGPETWGTYVWIKTDNLMKWEKKLVKGPYIHHCAGVYEHVAPVLYEACRYIEGVEADPAAEESTVDLL